MAGVDADSDSTDVLTRMPEDEGDLEVTDDAIPRSPAALHDPGPVHLHAVLPEHPPPPAQPDGSGASLALPAHDHAPEHAVPSMTATVDGVDGVAAGLEGEMAGHVDADIAEGGS